MSAELWHGTLGGYTNHHCRCDGCRHAKAIYMRLVRNTPEYRKWNRERARRWRAARKVVS